MPHSVVAMSQKSAKKNVERGRSLGHVTLRIFFIRSARAHDARPHCRLKSPFYRTLANTSIRSILPETGVPELRDGFYSIGLSVFTFT